MDTEIYPTGLEALTMIADIIIPFYNQVSLLSMCLKSIELSLNSNVRIILVNDGSDPENIKIIENSNFRLNLQIIHHQSNKGFRESIHTGLLASNHPYIVLLNSDTIIPPGAIEKIIGIIQKNNTIKAAAPVSNAVGDLYQFRNNLKHIGNDTNSLLSKISSASEMLHKKNWGRYTRVPFLTAACMALDRQCFIKAGCFSEAYQHGYFEDLDLSCRLRESGYELVVCEDAFVFHHAQGTYKHFNKIKREQILRKNFEIFSSRWGYLTEFNDLLFRLKQTSNWKLSN